MKLQHLWAFGVALTACNAAAPSMTDNPLHAARGREPIAVAGSTAASGQPQNSPSIRDAGSGARAGAPSMAPPSDRDAGPRAGSAAANAGTSGSPSVSASALECAAAIALRTCCPMPRPASASEVESDACLVPWPPAVDSELAEMCRASSPMNCDAVRCPEIRVPPSRRVGDEGSGTCGFLDECADDSDCVLAADHRRCCACPTPWPRDLVDAEPCVIEDATDVPTDIAATCGAAACPPCGACAPPQPVTCGTFESGLRTCARPL